MGYRTIKGNLAADPEVRDAGSVKITTFTVLENTGEYRRGEWTKHDAATPHYVEAKFELGAAAAAALTKGAAVLVEGYEHTDSWEREGETHYRRILDASEIAPRLTKGQQVTVTRAQREAAPEGDVWAAPEA